MTKHIHTTYHNFCNYMKKWYYNLTPRMNLKFKQTKRKYKKFESSKMVGYDAMCRIEKYAKDKEDIIIIGCDDNMFMSSDIALITHECKDDFMGTTMILIPQSSQEINQVFLYPEHLDTLIEKLQLIQIRQKEK